MRLDRRIAAPAIVTATLAVTLEVVARLLGRRSTQATRPPGRHLLIYDDDCGFCSLAATFAELQVDQLELIGFSQLPQEGLLENLKPAAVRRSAHYVTPAGVEYHCGESVTRLLRLTAHGHVVRPLDWPVLRGLRELGYRFVAWQRAPLSRLFGVD